MVCTTSEAFVNFLGGMMKAYRKIPKYSDALKIDVIILKFEICGFTIE